MEFKGKICLVTGGTTGIGAATAIALAQKGADVAISGRNDNAQARETKRAVEALGRRCEIILADFAKAAEVKRAVQETASKLAPIDIVVHSAGGPVNGKLFEVSEEDWYTAFEVHVHSVFHLSREVVPMMQKKKEGAIVLISSVAGLRSLHTNIAYQAVKGALPQLTRALAREFAEDNIRVNCVAPGVIRTRFHDKMSPEQKKLNLEQRIPLRREGTSEQVASLILQLIENDYITGETVSIDGGLTMRVA